MTDIIPNDNEGNERRITLSVMSHLEQLGFITDYDLVKKEVDEVVEKLVKHYESE